MLSGKRGTYSTLKELASYGSSSYSTIILSGWSNIDMLEFPDPSFGATHPVTYMVGANSMLEFSGTGASMQAIVTSHSLG